LRLLPDPARPIRHDTQADLRLGNQPGGLDLPERCGRLRVRLHLVPAQHLDDPVVREPGAAEPFGFPPLPRPVGGFGSGLLTPSSSAFGRLRAGGPIGAIHGQDPHRSDVPNDHCTSGMSRAGSL
jgi:hypothetical protein